MSRRDPVWLPLAMWLLGALAVGLGGFVLIRGISLALLDAIARFTS